MEFRMFRDAVRVYLTDGQCVPHSVGFEMAFERDDPKDGVIVTQYINDDQVEALISVLQACLREMRENG